jgi:hypothetical protein
LSCITFYNLSNLVIKFPLYKSITLGEIGEFYLEGKSQKMLEKGTTIIIIIPIKKKIPKILKIQNNHDLKTCDNASKISP